MKIEREYVSKMSLEYEIDSDLNSVSIVKSVSLNPSDEEFDLVPDDLLGKREIKN